MNHRRSILAFASAALACGAAAVPAQAGQFEYLSPSVIVMRGIAPSNRVRLKPVVAQAAVSPDEVVQTMTAEERRVLRYGVDEESSLKAAEAERRIVPEEEAAAEEPVAEEAVAEEAAEPVPVVRNASFTSSNTTVTIEQTAPPKITRWESPASEKADPVAMEAMARRQHEAESGVPEG